MSSPTPVSSRALAFLELGHESDVARARDLAMALADLLGLSGTEPERLGAAVTQLARQTCRRARRGRMTFVLERQPLPLLRLVVEDDGPGAFGHGRVRIDDRVATPLGGDGARRPPPSLQLPDESERHEAVVRLPLVPPEDLDQLFQALYERVPPDPVSELQQKNRTLLHILDELARARSRAEAESRSLRAVVRLAPVIVWQGAEGGMRHTISTRWTDTTGQTVRAAAGRGWLDVVHPEDRAEVLEAIHTADLGQSPYVVELRLRCRGTYRWFLERAERIEENGVVRYVGTSTDIDEAHEKRREAEELAVLRERMVGVVGHDLRNPLSSLMLGVDALRELTVDPEAVPLLDAMARSANRASRLVSDLLDYARGRAQGSLPVTRRLTDLGDLVRRVAAEVRATHPEASIAVDTIGPLMVVVDPQRVEQAVQNLLLNAIDHGDGFARVTALVDPPRVTVENHGPAIPAELRPSLFDAFRQGPRGGMGLGLWIANQVAVAHAGSLTFVSDDDITVFTLSFPPAVSPRSDDAILNEARSP